MSDIYDQYLKDHRTCVGMAYHYIANKIPEVLEGHDFEWQCNFSHDHSKFDDEEYKAYDDYFYGNRSYAVVEAFNKAWLHHIHNNPHHWQYWVLFEDDPDSMKPYKALEMSLDYIIEMICDWWSFSFRRGDLYELFDWYDAHKNKMILHPKTRKKVEDILEKIRKELDEEKLEAVEEAIQVVGTNDQ